MNSYIALDLETTSRSAYGRKINPFLNDIVAIGLASNGQAHSEYIYPNKLKNLHIDEDVILLHNATFDLLFLWGLEDLQDFFRRGGKIWCTQYAEYLLTGQQSKFAALRDIAVNKYGCKEREKKMEAYWAQGIGTEEIPKELVLEDVENDVLDTEKIYLKQVEKAKELGMFELIEARMDGLLATIEMEYNGLFVNKDILETNQKLLEQQIEEENINLLEIVKRYWK